MKKVMIVASSALCVIMVALSIYSSDMTRDNTIDNHIIKNYAEESLSKYNQSVYAQWSFDDLASYRDAANYYFGNSEEFYLQSHAYILYQLSENSIKIPNVGKYVYRLTTDIQGGGPDFMLRIEYSKDKSEGVLYSKCIHWEDKGISNNVNIIKKNRRINKKQIEMFEKALSQDRFWNTDSTACGNDGIEILFEGNDGKAYRVQNYFDGIEIENIHKTLFDMEKKWIIKEFSIDKDITKDQIKSVREGLWPLYGHIKSKD